MLENKDVEQKELDKEFDHLSKMQQIEAQHEFDTRREKEKHKADAAKEIMKNMQDNPIVSAANSLSGAETSSDNQNQYDTIPSTGAENATI
jgi:hypothetical protein